MAGPHRGLSSNKSLNSLDNGTHISTVGVYNVGIFIRRGLPIICTQKTQVRLFHRSSFMHFNSTKTILLALFSIPLVLGRDPFEIPPGYSPGNVNHHSVPQLVHIKDNEPHPVPYTGFVKSPRKAWVPIIPAGPGPHSSLPAGSSHYVQHTFTGAKVFDPEPDLRQPGYTIVQDEDANWNHYPPGTVPGHIVSQVTLNAVARGGMLTRH